jgi:hypothetical protein
MSARKQQFKEGIFYIPYMYCKYESCVYFWANHYNFFSTPFHVFTFEQTITVFLYTIPCVYFWTNHYRLSVHHSMCLLLNKPLQIFCTPFHVFTFEQTITDFLYTIPCVYFWANHYNFFSIQFHVFTFEQTITDFLYTIPCVYFWTKSYLPFLPLTETLVTKFVKRYQLCVLCNIRLGKFFVSRLVFFENIPPKHDISVYKYIPKIIYSSFKT